MSEYVECVSDHRLKVSDKNLCFNSTGSKHKDCEYRSSETWNFVIKHHISISNKVSRMLLTANTSHMMQPVGAIEIEGAKCRSLIDTG